MKTGVRSVPHFAFSAREQTLLASTDIDYRHTIALLTNRYRQQAKQQTTRRRGAAEIPEIDNRQIIDSRGEIRLQLNYHQSIARLAQYIPYDTLQEIIPHIDCHTAEHITTWNRELLERVGTALYPLAAFGLLNGGSATSYLDRIHNQRFNPALFAQWHTPYAEAYRQYNARPKALCAALYNRNSARNERPITFMELRARHLVRVSAVCKTPIPLVQMTSQSNHAEIIRATEEEFARHQTSHTAEQYYTCAGHPLAAAQPLLATFADHGEAVLAADHMPPLFLAAEGGTPYGLPGGHGQCWHVLRAALQRLLDSGRRFLFLGNIDNLGYTLHPIGLACLALHDGAALFEYVPRSAVDIKGGILVRAHGRLCGAELGSTIDIETVRQSEADGKTVLFNCAIGLFDLERLLLRLDEYIHGLPVHCLRKKTVQGAYWQLEQIAWDIISLIDNPYVLVGEKTERFLAAKLIAESFMVSGLPVARGHPLAAAAAALFGAMRHIGEHAYGIGYDQQTSAWYRK